MHSVWFSSFLLGTQFHKQYYDHWLISGFSGCYLSVSYINHPLCFVYNTSMLGNSLMIPKKQARSSLFFVLSLLSYLQSFLKCIAKLFNQYLSQFQVVFRKGNLMTTRMQSNYSSHLKYQHFCKKKQQCSKNIRVVIYQSCSLLYASYSN